MAIGYFPDLTEPAIRSELLHEDRFVCIARAGHPELRGRVSLDQFLELNHVTIIGEGRQESYDRWIRKLAPKREPRLRVSHFMSIPALVATTDMVSVVPQSLADTFAPLFGLQVFDPPIALPKIPVKQFWSRSMQAEPGLCWLRGLVAERFIRSNMRDASDRAPTPKSMSR